MPARILVCVCVLTAFAAAQVKKNNFNVPASVKRVGSVPVEMKADPCFHSELENSSAKIFQISVAPRQATDMDIHRHDYIVLALHEANFQIGEGSGSLPMQMGQGEMRVLQGGWPQRLVNTGDTPLQLVEVEVEHGIDPDHARCGLAAAECTDGEFGNAEGAFSASTLFETKTVKLRRVDLEVGGTLPKHNHVRSHVLVALADMKLADQQEGKDAKELELKAGDAVWYDGPVEHSLTNEGQQPAPIITMEFKD
jgi:quercetin dioxygenase-like cupin family protein